MTDEVPAGKAGVTEPGMKIAEGQHTPYQVRKEGGRESGRAGISGSLCACFGLIRSLSECVNALTQAFNCRLYLSIRYVWQVATGLTDYQMEGQLNWTAHRSRGYGVGSLHQKAGEPDKFWVQPGHPLAAKKQEKGKGGRFEVRAGGEGKERGGYGGEGYRVCWGTVRKGEGDGGRE
jgi:hypothetical protein